MTLHLGARTSSLATLLDGATELGVRFARDGDGLTPATVLVAPPDQHLLLLSRGVRLGRGPREHRARPAIDPLFRSAARSHGRRVVAVVLTGALEDGAAGLLAVRRHGGVALVQDPEDAEFPSMPLAAIDLDHPDLVAPVDDLAKALIDLAGPSDEPVAPRVHDDELLALVESSEAVVHPEGRASGYTCPECGGGLWESDEPVLRCRVGHVVAPDELLEERQVAAEGAVWTAIRTLAEQAELADRLRRRARGDGLGATAERYEARADDARAAIDELRALLRRGVLTPPAARP